MTPEAFKLLVRRLYEGRLPSEHWAGAMAGVLGVRTQEVKRWMTGRNVIPPGVGEDLQTLLEIAGHDDG
jgi:hypothetical protein